MDHKKKYHLFKDNKNFCAVPWNGFEIFPTGDIKTCAMGQTTLGNVHQNTVSEILQSDQAIPRHSTEILVVLEQVILFLVIHLKVYLL